MGGGNPICEALSSEDVSHNASELVVEASLSRSWVAKVPKSLKPITNERG